LLHVQRTAFATATTITPFFYRTDITANTGFCFLFFEFVDNAANFFGSQFIDRLTGFQAIRL
jgi:hypothetical protein